MVPEDLHVVHFILNGVSLFGGLLNRLRVSKLGGVGSEINNLIFVLLEFIKNTFELAESINTTAVVLEEFSLSHGLLEVLEFGVKFLDLGFVGSCSSLKWESNLLLGFLCNLSESVPVVVELVSLLLVHFLGKVGGNELSE
jgi:hypothetical protein